LIFNNQAIYDHPDWEMIDEKGITWREHSQRYGLACPNNEEYRKFLITQIKELKKQYGNIDALFFDMPYWEITCCCDSCQDKFKKMTGSSIPTIRDFKNPLWLQYIKARQDWMGEFVKYVKEITNEIFENKITIEFNFAAVVGCDWLSGSTEVINDYCEFTGGDLYGDLYNHSFVCKYYSQISKNKPFEYMTCRCNHSLREHTISKNALTLESEIMLTCLHHGASLLIDAINPDGTLDLRIAKKIGKAFEKQLPYEKFMDKGELDAKVAVYFDSKTMFNTSSLPYNKVAVIQTVRTLIENHIPFHVIANTKLDNLNKYDLIIAPCLNNFDNDETRKFVNYVNEGGNLYISGHSDSRLLKEFFGAKINGLTYENSPYEHVVKNYDEVQCYVYPVDKEYKKIFGEFNKKYPLPLIHKLPVLEISKGKVKAMLCLPYTDPDNYHQFAAIHSNPPGVYTKLPAIIENEYGKGKVVYSVAPIEADDRYNFKDIFVKMIKPFIKLDYKLDASKFVELITFKDIKEDILNLFDLNFANEIISRRFKLNLPNNIVSVKDALSGKEYKINKNTVSGSFKKYLSLICIKK